MEDIKIKRKTWFRIVALVVVVSLITVEVVQYVATAVSEGSSYINVTREAANKDMSDGSICLRKGDIKGAIKSFVSAIELYGADAPADVLLETAELYYLDEDYESALTLLKRVNDAYPKNSEGYLMMAEIYQEQEDYENALTAAENCLERDEESTRAYVILATAQSYLGDEEAAIKTLRDAMPYADEAPDIRGVLANIYYARGEYSDATEIFRQMIDYDPTDLESKYNLTVCLANLEEYDEMMDILLELEEAGYETVAVKAMLSQIYAADDSTFDKALKEYEDIIELITPDNEIYGQITAAACEMASNLEKYDEVIEYADKNLESNDPNKTVMLYRAIAYLQFEQNEEALADLNVVIDENPSDYAYYSRALAKIGLEDYEGAMEDLLVCEKLSKGGNETLYQACEEMLKNFQGTMENA